MWICTVSAEMIESVLFDAVMTVDPRDLHRRSVVLFITAPTRVVERQSLLMSTLIISTADFPAVHRTEEAAEAPTLAMAPKFTNCHNL